MESHAMVFLEPPANSRRIDGGVPQVRIRPPVIRLFVDLLQKFIQPVWCFASRFERLASLARAKARRYAIGDRAKEVDVLQLWFAGWASRSAKDSSRPDANVKDAFVLGIPFAEGPVHFFARRQFDKCVVHARILLLLDFAATEK